MLALGLEVGFFLNMALTPLAIFIGLLPMTLAGIGTRDAALIYFYLPYFSPASAAALGLFCTLRYVLPALFGLPFIFSFTHSLRLDRLRPRGSPPWKVIGNRPLWAGIGGYWISFLTH